MTRQYLSDEERLASIRRTQAEISFITFQRQNRRRAVSAVLLFLAVVFGTLRYYGIL